MSNLEHGSWAESIHCLTVIKQTVGPVSNGNNLVATEMYINTRTDKMSRKNLYEKIGIYFFFFCGGGGVYISKIRYQTWSESKRKLGNFVHTFQENFKHTDIVQSIDKKGYMFLNAIRTCVVDCGITVKLCMGCFVFYTKNRSKLSNNSEI